MLSGIAPLFRALRHRDFGLLWSGQTVSRVGDHLYDVAVAWWILQETGSAAMLGTVLTLTIAPMVVFVLVGGVAVDRLPRAGLMVVSDLIRGVAVLLLAGLAFQGNLEVGHVLAISLVSGLCDAFFQPAYVALVPDLAPHDDLPSANSLTSFSAQVGRVAGPALAAALLALTGTAVAFAVNGLSFVIAAALLVPVALNPRERRLQAQEPGGGLIGELREGVATVTRSPILWITILVASFGNILLAGPYSVAIPFLVEERLGGGPGLLGTLYAIFPIGYVIGGLWLGRMARIPNRGRLAYTGLVFAGLGIAAFGLPLPLVALAVAALINGAGLEVFSLIWTNLLQELVPPEKLGRVSSIDMLGSYALLPVGYVAAGWAVDNLGVITVFLAGGGATAALALYALAHPAIRRQK